MLILKRHNIKQTRENIAAVRTALRGVSRPYHGLSDRTWALAEQLKNALDRQGWYGQAIFDVLPVRSEPKGRYTSSELPAHVQEAIYDFYCREPERIPLAAVEALHAFYCEQTGTPDASMSRHSVRDATGKKQDTPALRFVTECLQTRNDKITVSAVEKLWRGRKSKGKKSV